MESNPQDICPGSRLVLLSLTHHLYSLCSLWILVLRILGWDFFLVAICLGLKSFSYFVYSLCSPYILVLRIFGRDSFIHCCCVFEIEVFLSYFEV